MYLQKTFAVHRENRVSNIFENFVVFSSMSEDLQNQLGLGQA